MGAVSYERGGPVSQVLAASPLREAPWWDATAEGPADENDLPTSGGRRAGLLVIDGDVTL